MTDFNITENNKFNFASGIHEDYIWENIQKNNEEILQGLNNSITNIYGMKINLIEYLLESEKSLPLVNYEDIITFFKVTSPFNIRTNMGSEDWDCQLINNFKENEKYTNVENPLLFIQNSISKLDSKNDNFINYIKLIKKKLLISNVKFNYFEFKSSRFYNTKDIIFVFNI